MTFYYTPQEVATIMGVHDSRIRHMILNGEIISVKDGGKLMIPDREVYAHMTRRINKKVKTKPNKQKYANATG